ncbi:hypothetical protein B0H65DRAFT_550409 [Neurospora tetraspora]|uniref:Uncharacterized protein n=1 Tax=Neurospora tetraspora TaxID=94610 RepID=A0AAE0JDP1_9PEZI|nr:hypothetical protein B0H65DRAFT_550409 [Neurospora tetraspora]
MISSTIGKAMGILQGLRVGADHLRAVPRTDTDIVRKATLCIFSDAFEVLRMIKYQNLNTSFRQEFIAKVINLVEQLSHELGNIPGFDVALELHWMRGHVGFEENEQADDFANKARPRYEGRDIFHSHGRGNRRRNHRRRANNAAIFSRHASHDGMPYSPPPWATDSFGPNITSLRMPRYPSTLPFSSTGGERPRVSEKPRPGTNEQSPTPKKQAPLNATNNGEKPAVEIEALEKDSKPERGVADMQTTVIQQFVVEEEPTAALDISQNLNKPSAGLESPANEQALACLKQEEQGELMVNLEKEEPSMKPEVQTPVDLPAAGMEFAANEQDLASQKVDEQQDQLPISEVQMPLNHEVVQDTEPLSDLEVQTPVDQPAEENDDSALGPLLDDQTMIDLQLEEEYLKWCERRLQDALASADNVDEDGIGETSTNEEVMSEEETQAAVDRQLAEEAEAALAQMMASDVQGHVPLGLRIGGAQVS